MIVFLLLIFFHELGHFSFAKLFGVKVNEFSIGMGPKLLQSKKTETKYSLRLIPFGGYCAMEGEDENSDDPRAFNNAKVYKRIIIVAAGAIFNIVLGFIFIMITALPGKALSSTTVAKFDDNAVTSQYGLEVGDKITSINGSRVFVYTDISFNMMRDDDAIIDIGVERNGEDIILEDVHFPVIESEGQKYPTIDFWVLGVKKNPITIIQYSGLETISVVRLVWTSLLDLVTGRVGLESVSGPVGTVSAIGDAASSAITAGSADQIMSFLFLIALITINLGVFNLLPIPGLDGARLVFLIIEAIRRKPINPKYEGYVHFAGLVALILLIIVVTFSDISHLIGG